MIKRTLKYLHDPGHGWLSVRAADIEALGIASQITSFSYVKDDRVYLEEDCDASLFLEAAEKAGWQVTTKQSFTNRPHWIRRLPCYHHPFATKNKDRKHA